MEEIEFDLVNDLPFCKLSKLFPDVIFYRWCNSAVDYLEFYGKDEDLSRIEAHLPDVEKELNTHVLYRTYGEGNLSVMLSCRCNASNSTIRKAESKNLMWKAPVYYQGGHEKLSLISPMPEHFISIFNEFERIGEAKVIKKAEIKPELVRDTYAVSMSDLLSDLTTKQLKYLVNAYHMGYFDTPKRTQIAEMAKQFGISYSTMQEHLEKAVNRILRGLEPYLTIELHIRGDRDE
ncbi:helix-turn-helix domain-containing protein [Thermoplasma sp. Kam2015]|uniref:helix-turn-helix domain-containing protein n=1 Tax=Thermoplasma sp. Kam2015 TaxID=2094122 RepID=UPI001F487DF6|nr:helix-turn-helix domain-containing protein [Thermoplasma sp. Kam2015]